MRTTPIPSADRRLPRMRLPPGALLVIEYSFACVRVRVFPGPPQCAGHPAAAPTRPDIGPAIHRPRRVARGEDCRLAVEPPGGPRPAPLPVALAGAARRPGEQSAVAPPTHPQSPDRRSTFPALCVGSRPPVRAEQLPCRECTILVT